MTMLDDRSEFAEARPRDVALVKVLICQEGRELTKQLALERYRIPPRRFRAAVRALRLQGYPIVSRSLVDSTYHRARTEEELEEFITKELLPRATDLFTQAAAMRRDARSHFAPIQPRLMEAI